jgi:hypothetical protein
VKLGAASIVSIGSDGSFTHASVQSPVISGDGRTVAFPSHSTEYAPWPLSDAKGALPVQNDMNIFVRDLEAKTTRAVNDFFGTLGISGSCSEPRLSEDGGRISFTYDNREFDGSQAAFVVDLAQDVPAQLLSLGRYQVGFLESRGVMWLSADGKSVLASRTGKECWTPRRRLMRKSSFTHSGGTSGSR